MSQYDKKQHLRNLWNWILGKSEAALKLSWKKALLIKKSMHNVIQQIKISFLLTEATTTGVLWKKVFLEILQNPQENTCARAFFNKVAGHRPATLVKKGLWHRCLPVNFAKFRRTSFYRTPLAACFCINFDQVDRKWTVDPFNNF